jgi:hypothetical protein
MTRRRLPLLCPSSNIDEPNARVLGVLGADGRLTFAKVPIPVTPEFIAIAKKGRDPSKRFRFTTPCIQRGCRHWENERCLVADVVTDEMASPECAPASTREQACPIKDACRWYHQRGEDACRACPEVIAHIFVEDAAQ